MDSELVGKELIGGAEAIVRRAAEHEQRGEHAEAADVWMELVEHAENPAHYVIGYTKAEIARARADAMAAGHEIPAASVDPIANINAAMSPPPSDLRPRTGVRTPTWMLDLVVATETLQPNSITDSLFGAPGETPTNVTVCRAIDQAGDQQGFLAVGQDGVAILLNIEPAHHGRGLALRMIRELEAHGFDRRTMRPSYLGGHRATQALEDVA